MELLLPLARRAERPMGVQIEEHLRQAVRTGTLKPGARVPSTRDLARQLGVSRGLVVNAYAQLGAEGYLVVRQGALPRVADTVAGEAAAFEDAAPTPAPPRYDFRPSLPDVSLFPRDAWLRCVRKALSEMTDEDMRYGDPRGAGPLRIALADYLGRVRGVVATPGRFVITTGYRQSEHLVCHALAARGAKRIALEDPGDPDQRLSATRAGLEPVMIDVDEGGMRIDELERAEVDAVILTPTHQSPVGVPLAGERRTALLEWLRDRDAIAIEDDYDAEFRYDRGAVGALQGLEPEHVAYAGTVSKTLAPALRLGWLVLPSRLVDAIAEEKRLADRTTAQIDQHAFAHFLQSGELDRHLRRMRVVYRSRRDALVGALADELPEARVEGIAAGLHATVRLSEGHDEHAIVQEAALRRVAIEAMSDYRSAGGGPPTLLIGYGQIAEPSIRPGIAALAEAVRAAGA